MSEQGTKLDAAGLCCRYHQTRDGSHPRGSGQRKLRRRMLLQVHDELWFEAPDATVEATARLVKTFIKGACAPHCELSVPLVVETGWAKSWEEAH